jgi:hypothetical protein
MIEDLIQAAQQSLLNGGKQVNIRLGLDGPAPHLDRGEREILKRAIPQIARLIGPAARLLDCGPFAGLRTSTFLSALERPKVVVMMDRQVDPRILTALNEEHTTAEVSLTSEGNGSDGWQLRPLDNVCTLAILCGGGLGFLDPAAIPAFFKGAADTLSPGDYLLVTLEMAQDGAKMEVLYQDFGRHIVKTALTRLGKSAGLKPRVFFDPLRRQMQYGALADEGCYVSWGQDKCKFLAGDWLDFGATRLFDLCDLSTQAEGFVVDRSWSSQDGHVELVLFSRK